MISPDEIKYGFCKWFNAPKGYGFIVPDDGGPDVMVHYRVIDCGGFKELHDGERVEFIELVGSRGRAATWCRVVAQPRTVEEALAELSPEDKALIERALQGALKTFAEVSSYGKGLK